MDGMHKSAKIFCMLHAFQLRKFLYSFFTVTAGTTSALNEFWKWTTKGRNLCVNTSYIHLKTRKSKSGCTKGTFSGNFSFQSHKFFTNTELCADLQLSAQSNRRVSVC